MVFAVLRRKQLPQPQLQPHQCKPRTLLINIHTCSMQGLKEQNRPLGLRHSAADGTTFHGPGRSKNTPSTLPASSSAGNPFSSMLRISTLASIGGRPLRASSAAASPARSSWNSKLRTRPVGATARASECVSDALPVPDSRTKQPGRRSRWETTIEMSARYRIWVRWRSTSVQSSGVGESSCTQPRPGGRE